MPKREGIFAKEDLFIPAGALARDVKQYLKNDLSVCVPDSLAKEVSIDCSEFPSAKVIIEQTHSLYGDNLFRLKCDSSGVVKLIFRNSTLFNSFMKNLRQIDLPKLGNAINRIANHHNFEGYIYRGSMIDFLSTDEGLLDYIDQLISWKMIGRVLVHSDSKVSVLFYDSGIAQLFNSRLLDVV